MMAQLQQITPSSLCTERKRDLPSGKNISKALGYFLFLSIICLSFAVILLSTEVAQIRDKDEQLPHLPRILTNYYQLELTPRVQLEEPKPAQPQIIMWKIQNLVNKGLQRRKEAACPFINSINIVTQITYMTVKQFLGNGNFETVFLMTDVFSKNDVYELFRSFTVDQIKVQMDSNFNFLQILRQQCPKMIYLFGNFKLDASMVENVANEVEILPEKSLYFTSNCLQKSKEKTLINLSTSDLRQVKQEDFYQYLYIFSTDLFSVIAPVNFLYYNKYTLEEIVLIPTLILYQSANKISTSPKIMHSFYQSFIQNKYFSLKSLPKEEDSLCFVSYPQNLTKADKNNAIDYLNTIKYQTVLEQNMINAKAVVYLPYHYGQQSELFDIAWHLLEMTEAGEPLKAKIVFMATKISPCYAVYQSTYSFCPNKTMIISSRHNVRFNKHVSTEIMSSVSTKYHYYLFNFINELGNETLIDGKISFFKQFTNKTGTLFQNHLRHIQVFKSDLMKMVPFWLLKNDQIDFYDTQAPFVYCMMQTVTNAKLYYLNKTLATVRTRSLTEIQEKQLSNLRFYATYSSLNEQYMMPYIYNSLENPALSRNAPKIIPPIIHQIWVGTQKISEFKMKLRSSIIKANPNFQVLLWKSQNITKELLPITYNLIQLIMEKNKDKTVSLMAMAADLMRYELLIIYGGIYLDFKFQGHKPLDNFLKYKLLFTDLDISSVRFARPKTLGNGFLGAPPNSYFLKVALHELMAESTINFVENLPHVTGSYKLRRLLTDHEVFTQIGLGYHLAIPRPYEQKKNYCGGVNQQHYDFDQEIFEVEIPEFPTPAKIGFPCKLYPQAFLVLVSPLKGTWLKKPQNPKKQ